MIYGNIAMAYLNDLHSHLDNRVKSMKWISNKSLRSLIFVWTYGTLNNSIASGPIHDNILLNLISLCV